MHHILTFTPVWRRPEIFEICLKGLQRLQNYQPDTYHIRPFFIVSESQAAQQIMKYNFDFIYYENQPLGAKKNAGLKYAFKNFRFDYIMEVGSDDLIANSYLDFIRPHLNKGMSQMHPENCWFIDTRTGKTAHWETNKVLGAGRLISHAAIKLILRKGSKMWPPEKNRGMDTGSWKTLRSHGIRNNILPTREVFTLDIKSNINLNNINSFSTNDITVKELLAHFPDEAPDILKIMAPSARK